MAACSMGHARVRIGVTCPECHGGRGQLVLLLCGAAFGLNVIDPDAELSFNATAPALLLAWLSYGTMTLAGLALWVAGPVTRAAGQHVAALDYGPLGRLNLFILLGALAAVVVPNVLATSVLRPPGGHRPVRTPSYALTITSLACACLGTAALAVYLGHAPIAHWAGEITGW